MSDQTLYPYHPVTGSRLTATIDYVPGLVDRVGLSKINGVVELEDGSETAMCWNAAEDQKKHGVIFLTNDDGDQCLEHEALWREDDEDGIDIEVAGKATPALSPNQLRDQLAELGSAAREVVIRNEEGHTIQDIGVALTALKEILDAMGLLEPEDDDTPDE